MLSLPRFLALSLILVLTLLAAGVGAQHWLRQQEQRMREAAHQRLQAQLVAAVELTDLRWTDWPAERLAVIGRLLGASVETRTAASGVAPHVVAWPVAPGLVVVAELPPRAATDWLFLFQRVLLGLGLLAVVLVAGLAVAGIRRPSESATTAPARSLHPPDVLSLAQLAQQSVHQAEALNRERDERLRAEAEARARLELLNAALEEKIRIGRDLHDGVIQSLYAAGLTLQSAQGLATRAPEQAAQHVASTLALINRTIAEIRGYISGLAAGPLRGHSLARALTQVVEELRAGRAVACDLQIDDAAAARLSDEQLTDTLQVTREAVSNALRHGQPEHLVIRLQEENGHVTLRVEDDGAGFAPALARPGGHGLANMQARAERGGGRFTLASQPGQGTRLELTWTTPAPV